MVRRVQSGRAQDVRAWALIFAAAFVAFTLKDDFIDLGKRVVAATRANRRSSPAQRTMRIAKSPDAFWVTAQVNGEPVRFLVDSGRDGHRLSTKTAQSVGIEAHSTLPALYGLPTARSRYDADAPNDLGGHVDATDMAVHLFATPETTHVLG